MTVNTVRLRELREATHLKPAAFAHLAGVDKGNYWRIENGEITNPSIETMQKIAAALRVPVAALLEDGESSDARPVPRAIVMPGATVTVDDPRLAGVFFGYLSKWARMTEEERDSVKADEIDIQPPRPTSTGDETGATGGAAGDAGQAGDRHPRGRERG